MTMPFNSSKSTIGLQTLVRFFCILLFSLTFSGFALSDEAANSQNEGSSAPPETELSPLEKQIEETRRYIFDLSENLEEVNGDDRRALQIQGFIKNGELRKLVDQATREQRLPRAQLISLVNEQQRSTQRILEFIESSLLEINGAINTSTDEEKFNLVAELKELQNYLHTIYQWKFENIGWLKRLELPFEASESLLYDLMERRLKILAASMTYWQQQLDVIDDQIKSRPESEQPVLMLQRVIQQQRLEVITQSLVNAYQLADKLGIATAEFKRMVFTVTGNITQDVLQPEVAFSIIQHWTSAAFEAGIRDAPQLLIQVMIVLLILLIARWFSKLARSIVQTAVSSRNLGLSKLMRDFFVSMSGRFVWLIAILVVLSQVGLDLTPVLTGFGIAGIVIGFALQDTLSNFASGMMVLIYKPFDVGDFVHAGGVEGKVSHLSLVSTTIRTFDNQVIIVPNSRIWGDVIKNVTYERERRVDMVFGIGYKDDLLKAEAVLKEIVNAHPAVLRSPEPMVKVHTLNTSSVDFIVRPWVKTDDYWDVYWDITREVKLRFDREGISIPFPQQDVHLHLADQAQLRAESVVGKEST